MRVEQFLIQASTKLTESNADTARLDSLILLEDATHKPRTWLLAHPEFELTDNQVKILGKQIERRAKHEPLAYIRGKTEFYRHEFLVNKHTLEPRPETETMFELLKTQDISYTQTIVDVGTGSGAIAITAKLLFPQVNAIATDIDNKCIQTAKQNAKLHGVSIDFRQGDLLEPILSENLTDWIVLANLPYVPDEHTINRAAMFEPKHAIFGGPDGLDYYRQMFDQIEKHEVAPTHIFTESLPFQHNKLLSVAKESGYTQIREDDFIQVFKND